MSRAGEHAQPGAHLGMVELADVAHDPARLLHEATGDPGQHVGTEALDEVVPQLEVGGGPGRGGLEEQHLDIGAGAAQGCGDRRSPGGLLGQLVLAGQGLVPVGLGALAVEAGAGDQRPDGERGRGIAEDHRGKAAAQHRHLALLGEELADGEVHHLLVAGHGLEERGELALPVVGARALHLGGLEQQRREGSGIGVLHAPVEQVEEALDPRALERRLQEQAQREERDGIGVGKCGLGIVADLAAAAARVPSSRL